MSLLFLGEDREYLLDPGETLETDLGILEVPEDIEPGETVETHLGTEFVARQLRGPDLFHHFERTGAPMMPRDIGLVMGHTGVKQDDRVLDAGTGTGVLAASLGRTGANVLTYERDAEFATVARENMALAGVSENVDVRVGDITAELDTILDDDRRFDLLTLDTEDAPAIVERAPALLVSGGFIAVYSPFVEAARAVVERAREIGLTDIECLETIQREMDIGDRGTRPSTAGVGHTGYLTFARKPA